MNKRINDLEFRWSDTNQTYELVQWSKDNDGKEFCYVLAFFDKNIGEGECDVRFVGSRPFKYEDRRLIWAMLKYCIAVVDAEIALNCWDD